MFDWPLWAGLTILFLVIEGLCAMHLVSIWFACGSLVSMFAAMMGAEPWLQILLFCVISAGLFAGFWPLTKKLLNPGVKATNIDAVIGTKGYVTEAIDNLLPSGHVKLGALEWAARSTDGSKIPTGTLVQVDKIEGVKVFVTPTEE